MLVDYKCLTCGEPWQVEYGKGMSSRTVPLAKHNHRQDQCVVCDGIGAKQPRNTVPIEIDAYRRSQLLNARPTAPDDGFVDSYDFKNVPALTWGELRALLKEQK